MKDKFKVHEGQNPRAPIIAEPPDPMGQAILLDQAPKNPLARLFHEDLVEQGILGEGVTRFYVAKDKEWGAFSKDRDVLAVTVLAAKDAAATEWGPLVGARVVVRLAPDFVVLDGCTRGDGTTIPLPGRVFPIETPLGRLLHCPLKAKDQCRVEIHMPGYKGARVRVILHTMRADQA